MTSNGNDRPSRRRAPTSSNYCVMSIRDFKTFRIQSGKIGYILLWLLGVPIPILILVYLLRGCT